MLGNGALRIVRAFIAELGPRYTADHTPLTKVAWLLASQKHGMSTARTCMADARHRIGIHMNARMHFAHFAQATWAAYVFAFAPRTTAGTGVGQASYTSVVLYSIQHAWTVNITGTPQIQTYTCTHTPFI